MANIEKLDRGHTHRYGVNFKSKFSRLNSLSISAIVWRINWSCRRSSPCLNIAMYSVFSVVKKVSFDGISADLKREALEFHYFLFHYGNLKTRKLLKKLSSELDAEFFLLFGYDSFDGNFRIEWKRNGFKIGEINFENGIRIGEQRFESIGFPLPVAAFPGDSFDERHQLIDKDFLSVEKSASFLPDKVSLGQCHGKHFHHRDVHLADPRVLFHSYRRVRLILALDRQVPVQIIGQSWVLTGSGYEERSQIHGRFLAAGRWTRFRFTRLKIEKFVKNLRSLEFFSNRSKNKS